MSKKALTEPLSVTDVASLLADGGACTPCEAAALAEGAAEVLVADEPEAYADGTATRDDLRWSGIIGVEGELTGDGRYIAPGALRWDSLPIPLRYVPADNGAHAGAVVVGLIESVERDPETGAIHASGVFDADEPLALEAARKVGKNMMRGVSMDLDDVAFEVRVAADALPVAAVEAFDADGEQIAETVEVGTDGRVRTAESRPDDEVMMTTSARLRAATIVAVPAFESARISMVASSPLACVRPKRRSRRAEAAPLALRTEMGYCTVDGCPNEATEQIPLSEGVTEGVCADCAEMIREGGDSMLAGQGQAFNWVEDVGGLPDYIKDIAKHLQAKGKTEGHAIAIAVNVVKKMCATGDLNFPGKQDANPASRARACLAVAEWEAKKIAAKADNLLSERHALVAGGGWRKQWRNPRDGRWIDMPGEALTGLLDFLQDIGGKDDQPLARARALFYENGGTDHEGAPLESKVDSSALEEARDAIKTSRDMVQGDPDISREDATAFMEQSAAAMDALDAYETSYIASEQSDIGAGEADPLDEPLPGDSAPLDLGFTPTGDEDVDDLMMALLDRGIEITPKQARGAIDYYGDPDAALAEIMENPPRPRPEPADEQRSGRGPHGQVRNFDAMNDDKFEREAAKVEAEGNDPEALDAVERSRARRAADAEPEPEPPAEPGPADADGTHKAVATGGFETGSGGQGVIGDVEAANAYLQEQDMTEYLPDGLKDAIDRIEWSVSEDGMNWAVEVEANRPLTQDEADELADWIAGQNSDGLGEDFEQQDFAENDEDAGFWIDGDGPFDQDEVGSAVDRIAAERYRAEEDDPEYDPDDEDSEPREWDELSPQERDDWIETNVEIEEQSPEMQSMRGEVDLSDLVGEVAEPPESGDADAPSEDDGEGAPIGPEPAEVDFKALSTKDYRRDGAPSAYAYTAYGSEPTTLPNGIEIVPITPDDPRFGESALGWYVGEGSGGDYINHALRGKLDEAPYIEDLEWKSPGTKGRIAEVAQGAKAYVEENSIPLEADSLLYRGIAKDELDRYGEVSEGTVIPLTGLVSTTTDRKVGADFANRRKWVKKGRPGALLEIETPQGTPVFPAHVKEKELVLPEGSLTVRSVDRSGKVPVIRAVYSASAQETGIDPVTLDQEIQAQGANLAEVDSVEDLDVLSHEAAPLENADAGRNIADELPMKEKGTMASRRKITLADLRSRTPKPRARTSTLVAAAPPRDTEMPPAAHFSDPHLSGPTPLTITDDGRVYGHLATWNTCHLSFVQAGKCVTPPRTATRYSYFHTGTVRTKEGAEIPVGHVTLDTKHAGAALGATAAMSHYDHTGTVVADVVAGEDAHGIWVSGSLRPGLSPKHVRALRAAPLSGDWRRLGGNLELVAALAVNVPGFPVVRPAGLVASGEVQALTAAGALSPLPPVPSRSRGLDRLSDEDLRYLKRLAAREAAEEAQARLAVLDKASEVAKRLRTSEMAARVERMAATLGVKGTDEGGQ